LIPRPFLYRTLSSYSAISLTEMTAVALMDRVDTKFVFHIQDLERVLFELRQHYHILEIDGRRSCWYKTLYFDTAQRQLFRLHHNGKLNRFKVRQRQYRDCGLTYLEVKFKSNKKKTIKQRLRIDDLESTFSGPSLAFLFEQLNFDPRTLLPSMLMEFTRLTMVHKRAKERATLDINLRFRFDRKSGNLSDLVIAELKQEKLSSRNDFVRTMRKLHIAPLRISKYCLACATIYPELKSNNFRLKFHRLGKIVGGACRSIPWD